MCYFIATGGKECNSNALNNEVWHVVTTAIEMRQQISTTKRVNIFNRRPSKVIHKILVAAGLN